MRQTRFFVAVLLLTVSNWTMASPGTNWLASHAQVDGRIQNQNNFAISYDFQATAATLRTWLHFGESARQEWSEGLLYLEANHSGLTEEIAKISTLKSLNGEFDQLLINELLLRINDDGGVGQAVGFESNILDTLYVLEALSHTDPDDAVVFSMLLYVLNADNVDNGYSLASGENSSVFISALVVNALLPYKNRALEVISQIQSTNLYLIQSQNVDGGWGETFETALSIKTLVKSNYPYNEYYQSVLHLRDSKVNSRHWEDDVYTTALALVAENLSAGFTDPSTNGSVTGVVVSSLDQLPLAGVSVVRDGLSFTEVFTNAAGQYALDNINAASHTLVFSTPGYAQGDLSFSIQAGDSLNLGTSTLVKTPGTGIIKGVVVAAETGGPLFNAMIEVESGNNTYQVNTNEEGLYQLAVPAGPFHISASISQRSTVIANSTLAENQTIDFSPAMSRTGIGLTETQITGHMIDAQTGLALSGVDIQILSESVQLQSNISGEFFIENLPLGAFQLQLTLSGYQSLTIDLVSGGGLIDLMDIAMSPTLVANESTLLGVVTDASNGDYIQGVEVKILNTNLAGFTDSSGAYLVEDIPNENYSVKFYAPGYDPLQFDVTGTAHGTTELNVKLDQEGSSALRIVEFLPERFEFSGAEEVELDIELRSNSSQQISTRLYLRAVNADNQVVSYYPLKQIPFNGTTLDASETLEPREAISLQAIWNTRFQEPGEYRMELLAFDQDSETLLKQASVVIEILSVKVVTGKIEFSPDVAQFDADQDIHISAELSNTGNEVIGAVDVTADVYLVDKEDTSQQLISEVTDVFSNPLLDRANLVRKDSAGNLIIYSSNNNQFARFKPDETFEAMFVLNNVFDFNLDDSDHIWTIDFNCQLTEHDATGLVLSTFSVALASCRDFEILNDNENFYVVNSGGVYNFNKNSQQLDLVIGNLFEDPQGSLLHSDGRLIIADGNANTLISYENQELSVWVTGLSNPHGIVEDVDGSVLVANYDSNEIIRIDHLGNQSVITNSISTPYDVVINPLGGYFVSSESENKLYQLDSNGATSVVYDSYINVPRLITEGNYGDVYIYNSGNQNIIRRFSDGATEQVATTPSTVTAMFVDISDQLVIGMASHIHRVESNGEITQLSNSSTSNVTLIVDGDSLNEYWFYSYETVIGKLDAAGNVSFDQFVTPFTSVKSLRTNSLGHVFVLNSDYITEIDSNGDYSNFAEDLGAVNGLFISDTDEVYISKSDKTIYQVDNLSHLTAIVTTANTPQKFAIDSNSDVFYTSRGVEVYRHDGVTETLFATLGYTATGDFVIDDMDRLWISHVSNNKISVVDSLGQITVLDTTGAIRPSSISVIDGTDSVWVAYRSGYFKIDLLGNVTDITVLNELSASYSPILAVTSSSFYLMQRGDGFQYDLNGQLVKSIGTFNRVIDMLKLNDELYLLTQTPSRRIIKYTNPNTLPDSVYRQTIYGMSESSDNNHLLVNTPNSIAELNLTDLTLNQIVTEVDGLWEKVVFSDSKIHLINYLNNLYQVYDPQGHQLLKLFGLNNLQGLVVADDGLLYLTDDESVYRYDGVGLEIIEKNNVGGYIHHNANILYKPSPSGNSLFVYNTLTDESNSRILRSTSMLRNVVFESDQDIKLVSALGLVQFGLNGDETVLVSSVGNISDIIQRQNNEILLATSNGTVQSGILKLSDGQLTPFQTNEELFGIVTNSLFESEGVVYAYSDTSVINNLVQIDSQPRKIINPFTFDYLDRMSSVMELNGYLYGLNGSNVLFKSKLSDSLEQLPLIGDLIHSDTATVDFSSGVQNIDFTAFNVPIAGEYTVGLSFSDAEINADLNDSLFVGRVAEGVFQIDNLNVPTGDTLIETNLLLEGLDLQSTVNLVREEAEELMVYDGNVLALTNYVKVDENTIIYTDGNNDQVKKYDRLTDTHSLLFTNIGGVTDIKKDQNNEVFLVNSPNTAQIQWIDENGVSLQIKDMSTLYGFNTIYYADYNSAGNMLVYGKFSGRDYSIIEIDHSTDTLINRRDNVSFETNMWVTSNDNIYMIGASITEYNLEQNRAVELREYIKREAVESNRNGVAVCENTVLFTDTFLNEETEIFEGAVRKDLIFNIDDITIDGLDNGTPNADFDSLMYDKESSSLLIFEHMTGLPGSPGRIINVPVNCGRMYVELYLRDQVNTSLSGFDVAPDQILQVDDDIKEYRWVIDDLDAVQKIFNFDTQVDNLLPNESRAILSSAYLTFKSDLSPLQDLTNPIPIPAVLGVPQRTVEVSLNQPSYPAFSDVLIENTIQNTATLAYSGSLIQHIEDQQGNFVVALAIQDVIDLPGNDQLVINSTWNTDRYFAGDYQLITQLLDASGDVQDTHFTPFIIEVSGNNQVDVNFNALTNQAQYSQNDSVEINSTLTNLASNAILENMSLELIIAAPDASILIQQSSPVNDLAANASQQWQDTVILNQAQNGIFTITFNLLDESGILVETFVYSFEVVLDEQLSLSGDVTLDFEQIQPGVDNSCYFEITNESANTVTALDIELMVVNLSNQLTVQSVTQQIDLAAGETWQYDLSISTDSLSSGDHACLIRSIRNGDAVTQASAVFTVIGANQLKGVLFDDFNGNGTRDTQDTGIVDVELSLLDNSQNVIQTATSLNDGSYQFQPVNNGIYTIVVAQTGVLFNAAITTDNNNLALDVEFAIIETNFGFQYSDSSVQGTIWNDANDDGQVGLDETGFDNVTIRLIDSELNEFDVTNTNGDGLFEFNQITSGPYQLEITDDQMVLDGLRNTTENQPMPLDIFSHADLTGNNFGYRLDTFDLDVFTTNCTKAVKEGQEITYLVQVRNLGNTDIEAAAVENLVPLGLTNVNWTCEASGGASCGGVSGIDDVLELIDIPQGGEVNYTINASVSGQLLDIIEEQVSITMPIGITDDNQANNQAFDSDMVLDLHFIDGFECSAPATPAKTQKQLLDILSSQSEHKSEDGNEHDSEGKNEGQTNQLMSYMNEHIGTRIFGNNQGEL